MNFRLKGISKSLELLIGSIIVVFILIITFKLLGVYAAYQYEQQAQITAKNLQTAMNRVCVSGVPMEVNVNFPQKLSSRGAAAHPLQFLGSILTGRGEAVTNALRYTAALQSLGDPWYVIYYEDFPLGEEQGWKGWSEVAGMRTINVAAVGIDQAMCISSIIPYTSIGRRIGGAFKKGGKWVAKKTLGRIAESIKMGKKTQRAVDVTMHTKEIIKSGAKESAKEATFRNNIYKKMIASGVKIKGGVKEIYNWFKLGADDIVKQIKAASRLERVAKDIPTVSDEMLDTPAGKTLTKKLVKYSDDILNNKEITNKGAKDIAENIKEIAEGTDIDHYSKEVAERLDRYKVKVQNPLYNFEPKEQKVITNLIDKLDSGAKIKPKEVEHVYKIIGKRGKVALNEWDDYLKGVSSVSEIQNFAKRVTPRYMIADSKPYSWTRGFLSIGEGAPRRLPGLGKALKYSALGTRIEGKRVATRYGVWYLATDNPWISFSNALSLADVSMLKFSPCSDHALCLKSQVNPSITIYPLDECKEAGINYIELEKYPEGGSIGTGFSRWIDENFGKAPYSKFYTASPCAGKIIINKTRCSCSGKEEPIIDYGEDGELDTYIFDCKLDDNNCIGSGCGVTCRVTKNMSYLKPPVTEDLGTASFSGEVTPKYDIDGTEIIKYEVNFDVGRFVWRIYHSTTVDEKVNCTQYILNLTEKFSCEFDLPILVGFTTACEGSDLWLECVNWTEGKTETKELHSLEGSKEIEITKWCCLQWNLTDYVLADKPTRKIINVSDCEEYKSGVIKIKIKNNLESALTETDASGHSIWNISDNITKLQNYADSVKEDVVKAIKNSSEIELEKGQNPNEKNINQLLMYNLKPEQTIPCLKVTYLKDDTKGFCYSSPAGTEKAKELFYMGTSIVADIGVTTLAAFIPGFGPAAAGFAGCEAGNLIMWAGQDQVSKEREKHLWPHNTFFGNYYTK